MTAETRIDAAPALDAVATTATRSARALARAMALVLLAVAAAPAGAVERQAAYFAGLAFLGDYQYIEANYPLTLALNGDSGTLDRALADAVRNAPAAHLVLRDTLGNLDRTDTLVLALALDRERVSREVLEVRGELRTKLIVDISMQVLLYDVAAGLLVDNVPVSAAINHVLEGNVADVNDEALSLARQLFEGDRDAPGLIDVAAQRIAGYRPRTADGLRFQLATLAVHERVSPLLPEDVSTDLLRQRLGQSFSARLADQTGVAVIPFTRGYAIGNQLPGRFTNGEAFNLRLPEPDFAFHVELKNLTRNVSDGDWLFGAQIYFTLEEPFTRTVSIAGDYRSGVIKPAAGVRLVVDDWSAHEDAAVSLLDALVAQLQMPERRWHRNHARDSDSYRQFADTKELFND